MLNNRAVVRAYGHDLCRSRAVAGGMSLPAPFTSAGTMLSSKCDQAP